MQSTYDVSKSYDWNYEHGPVFTSKLPERKTTAPIKLWGHTLNSPLGVPAGPLLNSNYIELYGKLGFDIPVYKTVRSCMRQVHPAPNCMFVDTEQQLTPEDIGKTIYAKDSEPKKIEQIAITNSFGMPSKLPEIWQADIEKANKSLSSGQLMIVSCVGTPSEERSIVDDYAYCTELAIEAGAKAIELNFSCPNVTSKEGSIFQDVHLSSSIAKAVKAISKDIPVMIKMGYIKEDAHLLEIIQKNAPFVDGIAAINTISMQARKKDGSQALPGEGRLNSGICGEIIRDIGLETIRRIAKIKQAQNFDFILCGVGGITQAEHFDQYLDAGADLAMSATGAMWDPLLANKWHKKA
tara:strand:- start:114 stop:1169 length:1056 start_codon:yes stop_codon:yes gene_type:complete